MASIYALLSERKLNGENLMRLARFHDHNTLAAKAMGRLLHTFANTYRYYYRSSFEPEIRPSLFDVIDLGQIIHFDIELYRI
ncbi:hypothetical protein [Nitrosomonas sp.]|uniref:hypothetical protein n=1 Tax=Nitrosomonas sp. TaxID=42353 RepID=UPI0037CC97A6